MRLTDDKILLKEPDEVKTAGGIYLPSNSKAFLREYEVVATGPGRYNSLNGEKIEMYVKKGDRVLVEKSIVAEVSIYKNGKKETYGLIPEESVEAILDEGEHF